GLTHNRLSILDVSKTGSQPMHSNRYVICFNGEIYNHLELRKKLQTEKNFNDFNGTSDTETILNCFEFFGVRSSLQYMEGMFALVLYDKLKNELILARDRFGEKPLYYGINNKNFYFSSELKALKAHPEFFPEINHDALSQFFKYSYIEAPQSIFKGIKKIMPGSFIKLSLNSDFKEIIEKKYWNIDTQVLNSISNPFKGSEDEAINELDIKLNKAVKSRMISDVPIGSFLSGGVDSSLVTALMQANSQNKVNTFSIGFNENYYDEAKYAKEISKHLNTNHNELYVNPSDLMDLIPSLPKIYDEPFADSSQLPTYLVSKLAAKKVKVCLSGDAGDEVFGGYNRYIQAGRFTKSPKFFKKLLFNGLSNFSSSKVEKIYSFLEPILPQNLQSSNPVNHYDKLLSILSCEDEWDIYNSLISTGTYKNKLKRDFNFFSNKEDSFNFLPDHVSFSNRMMFTDTKTYLCGDILCKVDRAAMANSLETRIPFLDRELFNFIWTCPSKFKIKNGKGKNLLNKVLYKYVPKKLLDRPKMGFGVPIDNWLRGPLCEWVEELLNEKRINEKGILNSKEIRKIWMMHKSGKCNMHTELWNILMFQAWEQEYL
ncbi:MAG: asparagine synthase (glutamine-hydrolyzing), partial [Flavobacteriaceae bacterium]|nr:asparagine synthase (glutamine-hydrolyzing) [Flavobacteriaceae bacterium]